MHEIPQHGATAEIFLPRLVARLHRAGFEGVARISLGIVVRAIYFRGGEIASAASNDEQDRLQSLLLKEGRLTAPQIEMARSRQKPGVSLGKTLIEMGFLTPSELLECARRQVRQILATCFAQTEGEFHLEPGPLPPEVTILGLPTRRLIFDALMEVGDRRRIIREMGSMESVYSPTGGLSAGLAALQLDPAIDRVARGIDGVRSLRDLSGETPHDDFTLSKAILALEILGLVNRGDAPPPAGERPARGRIIPVESTPGEALDAAPEANLEAEPEEEVETAPADAADAGDRPAEPPPFPSEDLPAFAVPPADSLLPPQWSTDPRTGERMHEGPIEVTFDGLVGAKERPQAVSTRLFAVTAVIVALVVLAFFLFAPGSRQEPPAIAGIGDRAPISDQAAEEPPAPRPPPRAGRPPSTGTDVPAAGARRPPPSPSPRPVTENPPPPASDDGRRLTSPTDAASTAPPPAAPRSETMVPPSPAGGSAAEERAAADPSTEPGGTPPAALDSFTFERSPDYLAALAQLDGGELQGAAQRFQRIVALQDPGRFTLQLMIACEPETVTRARAESPRGGSLFVLPYTYKGRSCFRTCWGIYPDNLAARAAVGGLPRAYADAGIKPIVVALDRLRDTR